MLNIRIAWKKNEDYDPNSEGWLDFETAFKNYLAILSMGFLVHSSHNDLRFRGITNTLKSPSLTTTEGARAGFGRRRRLVNNQQSDQ